MRRAFFVVLLLSFMAGERRIAWPASFDFTTIDVPNSVTTNALGINNQGQIVSNYGDVSGRTLGFLLSGGTFTTIDVANSDGTDAIEINKKVQNGRRFRNIMIARVSSRKGHLHDHR